MLLKVRQNRGPTPRNVTENDELTLPDILNSIRIHKTAVQFGDTRIALGMSGTSDSHRKCPQHQESAVRVAAGSFLWKLACDMKGMNLQTVTVSGKNPGV
jgi:hypothetical protein